MKNHHTKVLIVGGGPAGATAARILSQHGVNNILVEKNVSYRKPCGGGIVLKAFDEFGISRDVVHTVADHVTVVSPAGKRVKLPLGKHKLGIVDRGVFDRKLRDLAVDAGTGLIEGVCRGITSGEKGVTAEVICGDEIFSVKAEYVVAADGVHSQIRKMSTGSKPNSTLTLYKTIYEVSSSECQFWFGKSVAPQNYAWVFPEKKGVHVGTITFNAKTIRNFFETFLKSAQLPDDGNYKGYHIPVWKEPLFYKNGIFFAGDAAEQVLPLTYEGIYYAMQSAKLAAEAIIAGDSLLYEKRWRAKFEKRFVFMRVLQRTFLKSDFLCEKLIGLLEKPAFAQRALAYWSGEKSTGKSGVYMKVLKTVFLR